MHQLTKYIGVILAAAVALAASSPVAAQNPSWTTLSEHTHFWGSLGLGASRAGGGGGAAVRGALSLQHDLFVVTGRGTANTGGEGYSGYSGRDIFRDVGILAGYALRRGESWHTIGSVAGGVVTGNRARPASCS